MLPSAGQHLAQSLAPRAGLPTATPLMAQRSGRNAKMHKKLPHVSLLGVSLCLSGPTCCPSDLCPLTQTCPRRLLRGTEGSCFFLLRLED